MFLRFIYLFLERGEGREKEREKNVHVQLVASHTPPTGDLACNPGMCPDWKLNQQPFVSLASTQSTEPHQPGLICVFLNVHVHTGMCARWDMILGVCLQMGVCGVLCMHEEWARGGRGLF